MTERIKKELILDEKVPNLHNIPAAYDVPVVIDWYIEGYTHILVYAERKRAFLYFAAVSGLLDIDDSGRAYVAGMQVL